MSAHPFSRELMSAAENVLDVCRANRWTIATAESCTGGLIAAVLTEVAGSSDAVECGFVTYSNRAKTELLGVPPRLIESDGAVSERVARAMAEGALDRSGATIAVGCTGIAGPAGGTADKPVGLVHVAAARTDAPTRHRRCVFPDDGRASVRRAATLTALEIIGTMTS